MTCTVLLNIAEILDGFVFGSGGVWIVNLDSVYSRKGSKRWESQMFGVGTFFRPRMTLTALLTIADNPRWRFLREPKPHGQHPGLSPGYDLLIFDYQTCNVYYIDFGG